MRKKLCSVLLDKSLEPEMIFLTGDLGFMALEPLKKSMGQRFINMGVAEQNMMTVAAGLSRKGFEVWVYSIAPFCYARPFEQIRNDIAFHNIPVEIIGNGGGYGYGVMGPTHHAIEDYGVLLALPNMSVYVPVFDEDIGAVILSASLSSNPSYIRLGQSELPQGYFAPEYKPWRQLSFGGGGVVIAVGPLAGAYIEAFEALPVDSRPNLWVISELPLERNPMPKELLLQIETGSYLWVAEEHVQRGSFGSELMLHFAMNNILAGRFFHGYATAHHFDRYGSQDFLREKSYLDVNSLLSKLREYDYV